MSHAELVSPLTCFAHRGGSALGAENSLDAISQSLARGVDGIEIDVWRIKNEVLVIHDRRLGRLLPGKGRLLDYTPDELRDLSQQAGIHIPSLREVLELVGEKALLNIELKGPSSAAAVADELESYVRDNSVRFDPYIISSFDHHQLLAFKQRLPEVKRGVLVSGIPLDYAKCCDPLEAYSFHPDINFLNQALIDDAKQRGLKTWVYTVNQKDDMRHLSAMGVDGVFTDQPDKLLKMNAEWRKTA